MNGPEVLRWAASRFVDEDRVFDSDHDNALVAARLTELADRMDRTKAVYRYPDDFVPVDPKDIPPSWLEGLR